MGRTDSELESLPLHTALQWRTDAHQRISEAIGVVDSPSEMPLSTIMQSLKEGGYLPRLWESQEMWEFRMQWAGELSEMLRMVWDAKLTLRLKDKLSVSQDKLDELRYALSHYRGVTLPRLSVFHPRGFDIQSSRFMIVHVLPCLEWLT